MFLPNIAFLDVVKEFVPHTPSFALHARLFFQYLKTTSSDIGHRKIPCPLRSTNTQISDVNPIRPYRFIVAVCARSLTRAMFLYLCRMDAFVFSGGLIHPVVIICKHTELRTTRIRSPVCLLVPSLALKWCKSLFSRSK